MNIIAIIPARMGSTRFPGKPLADIHGMSMIGHVYFRCKMSQVLKDVYIATCDQDIMDYAESIGANAVMTANTHERCSDRTAEAMLKIEKQTGSQVDIVVMVQGDEPMVTPCMIDAAIQPLLNNKKIKVTNLMAKMNSIEEFEDPNEIKVIVNLMNEALYFSREPIPSRSKSQHTVPMNKQVCIIPFRRDFLLEFNKLEPTPIEEVESVDMMRILEHGGKVQMVETDTVSLSVDTTEDLARVIAAMKDDALMSRYL